MDEGELDEEDVSIRNVADEEARLEEELASKGNDELQNERKRRVEKLQGEVETLEKEIEELDRNSRDAEKKVVQAKRRKLVGLKLRVEDAQEAITAADQVHEEEKGETTREKLLRLGVITPFDSEETIEQKVRAENDAAAEGREKEEPELQTEQEIRDEQDDLEELGSDTPEVEDEEFEGGLQIPGQLYQRLFPYQRTGVKWMWELHKMECGGILGDEMGLGKTIQVIAFLAALDYSGKLDGPCLIIVPATLLRQWSRELLAWWPSSEVTVLHQSDKKQASSSSAIRKAMKAVQNTKRVMITTYELVRRNRDPCISVNWAYVVLDEGHRIRNPDADVTLAIKRLDTPHRIVMTGSPLQNRLRELWSLVDFIFPGRLGTLPVFEREFSITIATGGYATASAGQIHAAYHCAVVLRDLITPYILRRMKKDVAIQLPQKNEQILFCKLTEEQKEKYTDYLGSRDVKAVLTGNMNMLAAVTVLRKICNHPDLLESEPPLDYGNWTRSGKLKVLQRILHGWHENSHRVLLFAQTTTLLDLIEAFVVKREYAYLRMDGRTAVSKRMSVIDQFNNDEGIFIFLLTTKVGGFGVNLTGADRVVLYEPDWNPSNDLQARERAWRIGQKRDVTVYRLVTTGTIEEKIYHRQIYKQFLSSKVLNDPKQRRFFKAKDLNDLFTYNDNSNEKGTETGDIFAGTEVEERVHNKVSDDEVDIEAVEAKDKSTGAEDEGKKGDAAILQKLFESDGLHSTINHDMVMRAGEAKVDIEVIEHEATKIAREAARQLRRSRRDVQAQGVNAPTWTGRSGQAGRPNLGGLTSRNPQGRASNILNKMKKRNGQGTASEVEDTATLLESIRQFLVSNGGDATTIDIVNHFKSQVSGKNMITFKALLRRVAKVSQGGPGGMSTWTLLDEFRD